MTDKNYEPDVTEGIISVRFYDYSADLPFMLKYALDWLDKNKEYSLEDLVAGEDEGTYVTLYCKKVGSRL